MAPFLGVTRAHAAQERSRGSRWAPRPAERSGAFSLFFSLSLSLSESLSCRVLRHGPGGYLTG